MPCRVHNETTELLRSKRSAPDFEIDHDCPQKSSMSLPSINSFMKRLRVDNSSSCFINNSNTSISIKTSGTELDNAFLKKNRFFNRNCNISSLRIVLESAFWIDEDGNNELHNSILKLNEERALSIIDHAPSFDCMSIENRVGETALHLAVKTDQPRIVRRLICAGAAVDAVDDEGMTPLHLACRLGFPNVVRHLLNPVEYRETLNNNHMIPFQRIPQNMALTDNDGNTCLRLALKHNRISIVKLLLCAAGTISDFKKTDLDCLISSAPLESSVENEENQPISPYQPLHNHNEAEIQSRKPKFVIEQSNNVSDADIMNLRLKLPKLYSQESLSQPDIPTN